MRIAALNVCTPLLSVGAGNYYMALLPVVLEVLEDIEKP